jgi:hypothetical protein
MGHPSWTLKADRLRDPLEIFTMTTKTVINRMTELMNQGIE